MNASPGLYLFSAQGESFLFTQRLWPVLDPLRGSRAMEGCGGSERLPNSPWLLEPPRLQAGAASPFVGRQAGRQAVVGQGVNGWAKGNPTTTSSSSTPPS